MTSRPPKGYVWKKFGANSDIPNEVTRRDDDDQPAHVSLFLALLKRERLPAPVLEAICIPRRKFRCDFAWITERVVLEVEGGIFTKQAHGSISGLLRDIEKYNLLAVNGYRVLRCIPDQLNDLGTIKLVRAALTGETPA